MKTLRQLSEQLKNQEISSKELVAESLKRAKESKLNAFIRIDESALERAELIDKNRAAGVDMHPLAGIPIGVKDNIMVKGWENTGGSQILEGHHSVYNATTISRLEEAGMIFLGRANMDEFAMGSSTETSHFGATKNPWDHDKVPGGSSGGSAASVAGEIVPAALGSDTGGSVRQPASLCGITGLKPTYGRLSRYGLMSMASSLDQIGPLTRTVDDAAMLMMAMEGKDPKDATSNPFFETIVPELLEKGVKGMRIGIPKEYFIEGMDESIKTLVMHAINRLEEAGAIIKEVSLPHTQYALETYYVIMPAEVSSNMARFDGVRYGFSASGKSLIDAYMQSRGEGFGREVKRRIMVGTYVLSAGYRDEYYRKALQVRSLIKQDFDKVFKEVDIIASPTSPSVAWPIGEKFDDPITMYLSDIYTISANLAGIPALSLPCGFAHDMPVGLQLMTRPFNEIDLYKAGIFYQSITDWHEKRPSMGEKK